MVALVLKSLIAMVLAIQGEIFGGTHPEMIEYLQKYYHTKFGAFITK